jgi:hypothetical protein
MIRDELCRAYLTIAKLRGSWIIAAPGDDFAFDLLCALIDFCRERTLCEKRTAGDHEEEQQSASPPLEEECRTK